MKDNLKYMIKNWIDWDKKSLLYFSIRVPAMVFLPIITAFIPKAMIDCINEGVTVGKLTLIVALLSVLVTVTTWLDPFLNELLQGSARVIRMRYAVMAFKKNIHTDYINIESLDGREKNKIAMEFYRSHWSSSAYFITLCNAFLVCVLGVITSLTLIYKINIMMILLILLTCVGEFFLLRYLNEKEKNVKRARGSIFVKLDYYYELSKDNTAAKDIRLYGFSDYFISAYAKFVYELQKITGKYMRQSFNVSGTRAFLNMVRELVAYAYLVYLVYNNELSISDFIFYFGIITGFSNWIMNLVICVSDLERCCNDCQAFRDFTEAEDENDSSKISHQLGDVTSIEFKNVSFTYPAAEESTIKNMSFKVNAGENIAIVGENGAGKTSAVKLLCGLYYPSEGDILVNGVSSKDISKSDFFDLFSPVFQDYTFMPMTIAENICVDS
ncbi:MAG: ABC transporter ATP-binding protein, partial [Clostridia bacterium]|nr:ABC transporter ATP-binding protein [Clostridia bacterium]